MAGCYLHLTCPVGRPKGQVLPTGSSGYQSYLSENARDQPAKQGDNKLDVNVTPRICPEFVLSYGPDAVMSRKF